MKIRSVFLHEVAKGQTDKQTHRQRWVKHYLIGGSKCRLIVNEFGLCHPICIYCFFLRYVGQTLGNYYGPGTGQTWLDDLQCTGSETHLFRCRHGGWGQHNCEHSKDVSISCFTSVDGN